MITDEEAVSAIKEKTGFVDRLKSATCGSCRHMEFNINEEHICTLNDTFRFEVNYWSKCNRFIRK